MKNPEECSDMTDIRTAIDHIDRQVVQLIAQRAGYVQKAAQFKKDETAVRDTDRVKKVIESKKELAAQFGASPELIEKIYTTMIDFFVSEELKEWKSR